MKKTLLSLLAVASIGLCSSFSLNPSHSVAKPLTYSTSQSASSNFPNYTVKNLVVVIGSLRMHYDGTVNGRVLTLTNGSEQTNKITITSPYLNWNMLSSKTYTDPAILVVQNGLLFKGNTEVVKTDHDVKCKFSGRSIVDSKPMSVSYDIGF